MQFFKFWARADAQIPDRSADETVQCLGYSNDSPEDAERVAQRRADKTAMSISSGISPDQYEYAMGALREPIIEELHEDGQLAAIISRNSYGSLVLNSPSVLFGDVDIATRWEGASPISWLPLDWLFKKPVADPSQQDMIDRIEQLVAADSSLGFRLYRTAAGYRYVETSRTYQANESASRRIFDALQCDPLYRRLCKSQECFRARVSPKPWRIGLHAPDVRFPYLRPGDEQAVERWTREYDQMASQHATCALIDEFGSRSVHPQVEKVLQVHDTLALNDGRPLA